MLDGVLYGVGGRFMSIVPKKSEAGNPRLEGNPRSLELEFEATTQPITMLPLPLDSPCNPLQCYGFFNLIGNECGWICCMVVWLRRMVAGVQ